ncbi:4Fe-4S cluster-binding domain-containing protein [Serratia symbiotica]|uniref:4Fe-4S cluster-binding domain-containing protein n=1 Tax=Serratia symbiotica TaxID=138074 RepID=UPI000A4B2668|nr:4Fe-4S cluster-binding domain-containing protein [Serratia symbiotica]
MVNGPSTRGTLFVAGCEHPYPAATTKTLGDSSGLPFTQALEDQLIGDLNDVRIPRQGLSLSGGDPLHPANVPTILQLVKRVRSEYSGLATSWRNWMHSKSRGVNQINVLIGGKFVQDLKDPALPGVAAAIKWRISCIKRFTQRLRLHPHLPVSVYSCYCARKTDIERGIRRNADPPYVFYLPIT